MEGSGEVLMNISNNCKVWEVLPDTDVFCWAAYSICKASSPQKAPCRGHPCILG